MGKIKEQAMEIANAFQILSQSDCLKKVIAETVYRSICRSDAILGVREHITRHDLKQLADEITEELITSMDFFPR